MRGLSIGRYSNQAASEDIKHKAGTHIGSRVEIDICSQSR
jgi:hypothetical protein